MFKIFRLRDAFPNFGLSAFEQNMEVRFCLCFMDASVYLSTARFNVVCVDLAPTRRLMESPSA
jgi:hypothetical protein